MSNSSARPFPWFWLVRMGAAMAAAVVWEGVHANPPLWQFIVAGMAGSLLADLSRKGFEDEQQRAAKRRSQ